MSGPLNTDAVWSLGFSVTGTFRIYVTAESLLDYSVSLQGSISRTSILVMVGKTGFPMIDACSQEKTNLNILMKLPILFSLDEMGLNLIHYSNKNIICSNLNLFLSVNGL